MNNSRKLYHYAVDTFVELLSQIRGRKICYKCSDTDFANWDFFAFQYRSVNIGEDNIGILDTSSDDWAETLERWIKKWLKV